MNLSFAFESNLLSPPAFVTPPPTQKEEDTYSIEELRELLVLRGDGLSEHESARGLSVGLLRGPLLRGFLLLRDPERRDGGMKEG